MLEFLVNVAVVSSYSCTACQLTTLLDLLTSLYLLEDFSEWTEVVLAAWRRGAGPYV